MFNPIILGYRLKHAFVRVAYRKLFALAVFWYGKPDYIFSFTGGLGDHLLCTIPFRLLKAERKKIWFITNYKELYVGNKDVVLLLKEQTAKKMNIRPFMIRYEDGSEDHEVIKIPPQHIVRIICNRIGVSGMQIKLKPILILSEREKVKFNKYSNCIIISTSGLSAKFPIITKEWYCESYQQVANALKNQYSFVQVGSVNDPGLKDVVDLRGKLNIRETAAVLSNAALYVGQVGFLMHLARSVDCKAVIIYGGREKPWQSGYAVNINITSDLECSPCWKYTCNIDRLCMKIIEPDYVVLNIKSALKCTDITDDEFVVI